MIVSAGSGGDELCSRSSDGGICDSRSCKRLAVAVHLLLPCHYIPDPDELLCSVDLFGKTIVDTY